MGDQQPGGDDKDDANIKQAGLLEQRWTDHRNAGEQRNPPDRQSRNQIAGAGAANFAEQERGDAEHEDVEADPDHELVGSKGDAEHRLKEGNDKRRRDTGDQTKQRCAGRKRHHRAGKGAAQHHPFQAEVEHACLLADEFAGGREG
jgi:hypothetical protein